MSAHLAAGKRRTFRFRAVRPQLTHNQHAAEGNPAPSDIILLVVFINKEEEV